MILCGRFVIPFTVIVLSYCYLRLYYEVILIQNICQNLYSELLILNIYKKQRCRRCFQNNYFETSSLCYRKSNLEGRQTMYFVQQITDLKSLLLYVYVLIVHNLHEIIYMFVIFSSRQRRNVFYLISNFHSETM